ncbi:MAG: metallophosphoesterase, partial [Cetobacterium sp.]|uniref:metallophosphoesterase n=1 Tax=Cetobacterium sp. TaxID=2071632 RepID=UPI003EE7C840
MTATYFISDPHFSHRNILKYRKQFESIHHHDSTIISNWNQRVTKRDKVFVLGDACFDENALELVSQLNGTKHLVMGNHEFLSPRLWEVFSSVSGPIKYKEFWLSHMPIHPEELRGKKNIHGHMHGHIIDDQANYFNVSCECLDYTPINLQDIRKEFRKHES